MGEPVQPSINRTRTKRGSSLLCVRMRAQWPRGAGKGGWPHWWERTGQVARTLPYPYFVGVDSSATVGTSTQAPLSAEVMMASPMSAI